MTLRLFRSVQDAAENRRRRQAAQAMRQARCTACGAFVKPRTTMYGGICQRCVRRDTRAAIRRKVEQAKLWWQATPH